MTFSNQVQYCSPNCVMQVYEYISVNLITNQILSVQQCAYGAITVTCDTTDCTLEFTPVTYNTFKHNVVTLGTLLCNYVNHWSTARWVWSRCESPSGPLPGGYGWSRCESPSGPRPDRCGVGVNH